MIPYDLANFFLLGLDVALT